MSLLTIKVTFIAHSYSGVRILADRREVLDWPPSPARLHEALLSSALVGVPRSTVETEEVWAAFRWFETLPPPVIFASAQNEELRTSTRIAIPQNNPNKTKLHEHSILLAPTLKAIPLTDTPLEVVYQWDIGDETPEGALEILRDATARVSYFGRGEDRAEVSLSVTDAPPTLPLVRWLPDNTGDTELWGAISGTTDGLRKRHTAKVPPRETRMPAQRWMRLVRYSDDAPQPTQAVSTAIFLLFPDDDDPDARPLDCDPQNGGLWREFFRHLICDMAEEPSYWDDPAFASELLTGHVANKSKNANSHLAIVPLPSLNANNTADGRIRRIALLGYAPTDRQAEAREIFETVFRALDDRIETLKNNATVRIVRHDASSDKIWYFLTRRSRSWATVSPVAISRHFNVPQFKVDDTGAQTALSENERIRYRNTEIVKLLRSSLEHIGIPPDLAQECHIELTSTPLIPRTLRAERYRPPNEKAFITHAYIEFPRLVRGPLLLGDRRYFGLGLFAAVPEVSG